MFNIRTVLSTSERRLFAKLRSPASIQDYLDTLPVNFELSGETYMSPVRTIRAKTAHCFEGAILGATALAFHGQKPLLMDLQTIDDDEDHVVALFKQNGLWGAISKTNHAVLRWRDPIFKTPRELALSYFHEYFMKNGKKSLKAYSAPYDLSKFQPQKWVSAEEDLFWLVEALDKSRHFPFIPKKNRRSLRYASKFEIKISDSREWNKNGARVRYK